jgi:hypothetical protein
VLRHLVERHAEDTAVTDERTAIALDKGFAVSVADIARGAIRVGLPESEA